MPSTNRRFFRDPLFETGIIPFLDMASPAQGNFPPWRPRRKIAPRRPSYEKKLSIRVGLGLAVGAALGSYFSPYVGAPLGLQTAFYVGMHICCYHYARTNRPNLFLNVWRALGDDGKTVIATTASLVVLGIMSGASGATFGAVRLAEYLSKPSITAVAQHHPRYVTDDCHGRALSVDIGHLSPTPSCIRARFVPTLRLVSRQP
jgi:hypothetical protein